VEEECIVIIETHKTCMYHDNYKHRISFVRLYLYFDCIGDYSINNVFCKRVKVFVCPSHELWFQQVPTAAIVFKHPHVHLHRKV